MKNHYLYLALALLNTLYNTVSAEELTKKEENGVSNMIAEDTAEVMARLEETEARRIKRSDDVSPRGLQDEILNSPSNFGADAAVDESEAKSAKRKRCSLKRAKRLLDNLEEIQHKRSAVKKSKHQLPLKKRTAKKGKHHHESMEENSEEEEQSTKQKIKRKIGDVVKQSSGKKGKRGLKKLKRHVGARCTEPCNACQTTEEFTLPSTTEAECCETKPKCKSTTTCRTTTTPCDVCDTKRLEEDDGKDQKVDAA